MSTPLILRVKSDAFPTVFVCSLWIVYLYRNRWLVCVNSS